MAGENFVCITNIPNPYRVHEFSELKKAFALEGIAFKALFMAWEERGRNWHMDASSMDFAHKRLKGVNLHIRNVPFIINPGVIVELMKEPPRWLLLGGSWYQPTNLLAMLLSKTLLRGRTHLLIWYENPGRTYISKGMAASVKRWVLLRADAFVVPGERAADYLKNIIGSGLKLFRLANFVDESLFGDRVLELREKREKLYDKWGIDPGRTVFFLPARLIWEKGILPFLEAIEAEQGEFTILIAGEGAKRDEICAWLSQRKHMDVRLLGYQEEEGMLELYALSDILLLPSIYEPYGFVCVEALWAGLPLLVSGEVGSLPEVLEENVNGWSFDPGDARDAREKFGLALAAGKDKLMEMGKLSTDIATTTFTSSKNAHDFVAEVLDGLPPAKKEKRYINEKKEGQRLFFFGSFIRPEDAQNNPYASPSTNKFQHQLLRGLVREGFENVTSLSVFPYASFPRGNKLFVGRMSENLDGDINIINPAFFNIPLVKQISIFLSLFLETLRESRKDKPALMLSYNPRPFYAGVASLYSKINSIPHIIVVADYEHRHDVSLAASPLRYVEAWLAEKIIRSASGLICLSGKVVEETGYKGPWLKMEGAVDEAWKEFEPKESPGDKRKIIMYSGAFSKWGGLDLLLDAFALIKGEEFRLWISGKGDTSRIEESRKDDPRIEFLGYLGEEEYKKAVSMATVLVNPRRSGIRENRYNFPSKLLDYLASGKPVISTVTGDVGDDYSDKVFVLGNETPEGLAALIEKVCAMPREELRAFGEEGRSFVLKEKTWGAQCRRICEFIMHVKDMGR